MGVKQSLPQIEFDPADIPTEDYYRSNLQWTSHPVTFHRKYGDCIQMFNNHTIASHDDDMAGYSIVSTKDPVAVGHMLKVTVEETVTEDQWAGGLVSCAVDRL